MIRTPDDRFVGLPDSGFRPHFIEWDGMRLHHLDESAGRIAP